MRHETIGVLALVTAACAAASGDPDESTSATTHPITDGVVDTTHTAVGRILAGSVNCSATLVGPRTVLTAAHCVPSLAAGYYRFEVDGQSYPVERLAVHPEYDRQYSIERGFDLAIATLAVAPPIPPAAISSAPVRPGQAITLVGYQGIAERRSAVNTIASVTDRVFRMEGTGNGVGNICFGDSGGATFASYPDGERVVGVHSYSYSETCGIGGGDGRLDLEIDWIRATSAGDARVEAPPLALTDVVSGTRSAPQTRTEYLSLQTGAAWQNARETFLFSADSTYTHNYPGRVLDGYLAVAHTFDDVAGEPYTQDLTVVDRAGAQRQVRAYFPAFATTGGRKMIFWVAEDGSTYYADAEHDGVNDEWSEMLPRGVAMTPAHLARRAPRPLLDPPDPPLPTLVKRFGNNGADAVADMAEDSTGRGYAFGQFGGIDIKIDGERMGTIGAEGSDALLVALGTDNRARWTRRIGGTGWDSGHGVAVDGAGNVYVVGVFERDADVFGIPVHAPATGLFVASVTADGVGRWARGFSLAGPPRVARSNAFGNGRFDVAADTAGRVVITGPFEGTFDFAGSSLVARGTDVLVASFVASDGTPRWARSVGSDGNDDSASIATDTAGNMYITGMFAGAVTAPSGATLTPGFGGQAYVWSFDASGGPRWGALHASAPSRGNGVAVSGNTGYMTGWVSSVAGSKDAYIETFNTSTGARSAFTTYHNGGTSPGGVDDAGIAIHYDGFVHVVGTSDVGFGRQEMFVWTRGMVSPVVPTMFPLQLDRFSSPGQGAVWGTSVTTRYMGGAFYNANTSQPAQFGYRGRLSSWGRLGTMDGVYMRR